MDNSIKRRVTSRAQEAEDATRGNPTEPNYVQKVSGRGTIRLKAGKPGPRVLVLGATGKTGRLTASGLRQRGVPVRAVSRSSATPFDWYNPDSWTGALDGIEAVYLATPTVPDLAITQVSAFVKRAVEAGVRHAVLLSGRSARAGSARMLALEDTVRDSGIEWTILRPSVFNQNFSEGALRQALLSGEVRRVSTGGVPIDFIDVADIADVAQEALVDPRHRGQVYELSGPRALTYAEAVQQIADAIGRPIRLIEYEPDQWAAEQLANGVPQNVVDWSLEAAQGVRDGYHATPFDGVPRVLGRPARAFEEYVRDAMTSGVWATDSGTR